MAVCVTVLAMVCEYGTGAGITSAFLAIVSAYVGWRVGKAQSTPSRPWPPRPPQWQPEFELEELSLPAVEPSRDSRPRRWGRLPRPSGPPADVAAPPQPPEAPPDCVNTYLAMTVAQRGAAAWSCFWDHGFVVIDLGLDNAGKATFANVASQMASSAADPHIQYNRGPGRTCVNDVRNIQNSAWQEALKIILGNDEVKIVLSELIKSYKLLFHDCGGDYVEAGAADNDNGVIRNPCRWHRDYEFYLQWFCISVLAEDTDLNQGPLQLESWSASKDHVLFYGHAGLCVIRDVYNLHCGSANNSPMPRAMPSFRFSAANAASSSSLSVPQLLEFIGV